MLIPAILASLGAGLALKLLLDRRRSLYSITWIEFALGAVITTAIVVPLTLHVGKTIAVNNQVGGFAEHWNGYETDAIWDKVDCSRDGPCKRERDLLNSVLIGFKFPSDNLVASQGSESLTGDAARAKMYDIVILGSADEAYQTGEDQVLTVPGQEPAE